MRIRCWGSAPSSIHRRLQLIAWAAPNGLYLCRLPCFRSGFLVGFTKISRSKSLRHRVCVCVWRLAGPEETLHWKLQQSIDGGDLKVYGKTKKKGEDRPTPSRIRSFELASCTTSLKPEFFKSHAHLSKDSAPTCVKLRPIADLQYRE